MGIRDAETQHWTYVRLSHLYVHQELRFTWNKNLLWEHQGKMLKPANSFTSKSLTSIPWTRVAPWYRFIFGLLTLVQRLLNSLLFQRKCHFVHVFISGLDSSDKFINLLSRLKLHYKQTGLWQSLNSSYKPTREHSCQEVIATSPFSRLWGIHAGRSSRC